MHSDSFRIRLYQKINQNKKLYIYTPLVIYWIILLAATSFPSDALPSIGINDKYEHLVAYFILSVLFGLTLMFQEKNQRMKKNWNSYTVMILLAYGIFDEVHQYFIPGRYFDWIDLLANFVGIILGVYFIRKYFALPIQKELNLF